MRSNFTKYLIDVYIDAQNNSDYFRSIICKKSQIIWTDRFSSVKYNLC
jgi:hypothetical protein